MFRMKCVLVSVAITLLALPNDNLLAQWSSDSLQNTAVIQHSGSQEVDHMQPTSDGGCYVAWYDTRNGNYDMYLQRLNALGEKVWPDSGLMISNHAQQTWVTDYDLAVDQNDNAILVFNDMRNGDENGWDVFAYKIAPDGGFLWGADGIDLSQAVNSESEMAPKVAVTSAGNYVFVWSKSNNEDVLGMQKLSADGQKQWGDGLTISGQQGEGVTHPQIVAAADDSVIVLWKSELGSYPATKIWLVAQKYTPDGQQAWASGGVVVYNNGDIPVYYDPVMIPDGSSGAFMAWEDQPSSNESYVYVGHIGADGTLIFPMNGIMASTDAGHLHNEPSISYMVSEKALFCFWLEKNTSQDLYGIYGQKFNTAGNRMWGDTAKEFIGLGERSISFVENAATDSSLYVGYFQNSAPNAYDNAVKAFYLHPDGQMQWGPEILSAASLGQKDDLRLMLNSSDQAFLVWSDTRNDDNDIYAQNVRPNGAMGNAPSALSGEKLIVTRGFALNQNYPNPFNPSTKIGYRLSAASRVKLSVFNTLGQKVRTLLDQRRAAGKYSVSFNADGLPAGIYLYRLSTGNGFRQTRKMILLK